MTFLRRWWLPVVLIGAAVAGGVWYVNHLRNQGNEAAQDRDRLALELAGANAVHEVTARDLRREVTRLTDTNAGLQAEIDKVRGAMPGAGVVGTASGSTGGITVGPAAGIPGTGSPPASGSGATPSPVCPACALLVGDRVELKVAGVALQGDSGAVGGGGDGPGVAGRGAAGSLGRRTASDGRQDEGPGYTTRLGGRRDHRRRPLGLLARAFGVAPTDSDLGS